MKAVLLAAGIGKRLKPLTDHTPKPLIPLCGKPILEWILSSLKQAGVTGVAIITGHLAEKLETYFGTGSGYGLEIAYFRQEIRDGTARAVLPARDFIGNAPFFLGYGDIFVAVENYTHLFQLHHEHPVDSVLSGWEIADPSQCGALKTADGKLLDIVEKPAPGTAPSNLINAGMMILQPQIFHYIDQVKPSPRGEYELTDALVMLSRSSVVHVLELTRFWSDIGTKEKLLETAEWIQAQQNVR